MIKRKAYDKNKVASDPTMLQVLGTLCAKLIADKATDFVCDLVVGKRKFHFTVRETEATEAEQDE
jgi:hypothetical protein